VFAEALCAELWEGQCCYVARFVEDWCGEGRPFVVGNEIRTAEAVRRADWIGALPLRFETAALDASQRRALAEAWLEVGLAEHASVASFARFVLELAAVGAPADLLADASVAMRDEIRHAELAFAIASALGGKPVGPGPVPMHGVAPRADLEAIVRATVREGCVGETLSAAEVELAARRASGTIARVLAEIADDEARHSVLAWRFVQWAVRTEPRLQAVVRDELARAVTTTRQSPADALPPALAEAHGHLDGCTRADLRARTLAETVLPCAAGLLDLEIARAAASGRAAHSRQ
jgi:hypothetical protein